MAQRKNPKPHSKKEGKTAPVESKNGKRTEGGGGGGGGGGRDAGGGPKYSMFTWFMVLALLGVWSSVAVVYFDIVDYDTVIGKLTAYDTDGDGDFDVEDAKVLLGLKEAMKPVVRDSPEQETVVKTKQTNENLDEPTNQQSAELRMANEPTEATSTETPTEETTPVLDRGPSSVLDDQAAVPLPSVVEDDFVPDDPRDSAHPYEDEATTIDSTGVLVEEPPPEESIMASGQHLTSSKFTQEAELEAEKQPELEPQSETLRDTKSGTDAEGSAEKLSEEKLKEKAKKKKPKLLNKFDKTIKAEIDAAEKLRKKGKAEEALKAFELLVHQYPQSPRARYGKAQAEDDMAEKLRSNDMLQRAINTYREAAELPDVTPDLLRATLKRRAERQQFLGSIACT